MKENSETTDLTLFVRTSGEEISRWNRQRIVDALVREANIDNKLAQEISKEVEKQIFSSSIGVLTTALIRELVNARLVERGLEKERRLHGRLGFPLYDVRQLILHQNKENANIPHSPEGTNLIFAEGIKREFSLYDVFSPDTGEAHAAGDIHIHGLGYIDRPYSCCQTLEYLKINGLKLPQAINSAKPARHAEVLLAHMVRFSAALQGHFTGTIIWDALNISFAPYLGEMSDKQIRQFAQMLIYEFSQLAAPRGGQALYTDIHIYCEIPVHWAKLPAIGPGGEPTGKTYAEYEDDARRFAGAICEVFIKGDATGKPFILPRPLLHITESSLQAEEASGLLQQACAVASLKGNICFVFDRDKEASSFVCFKAGGKDEASFIKELDKPWLMRTAAIQSVTVNLPRIAYKAAGNDKKLWGLLQEIIATAVEAHIQKKDFLEKLLSYAGEGPLALLAMNNDGFPYLRMNRSFYIIGLAGLNELVQIHLGKQLHEAPDALAFGLKVVEYLQNEVKCWSVNAGMRFLLEQTPAETTAYRFARLDLKYYSPAAGRYVKGSIAEGAVYYTNSTHLNVAADITPIQRVIEEGFFHKYLEGEIITHLQTGSFHPDKEELSRFIRDVFYKSANRQVDFSPEFTSCFSCGKTAPGLNENCIYCGSTDVEGIARLTKYYSKVLSWNKGKLAELKNRRINKNFNY
ncbi:MAG: Anaerobic ribonucleoside-triphosphate reductase [Smithella sp. PtaU1.Bin162]|nr:MAG: Anaerobic ribonucleoside-triphosphate reductase [Smithella sp. PtaU1.Bin162]